MPQRSNIRTRFITLRLANSNSHDLVDHIDLLRLAFRHTVACHPFMIDAICILPNRLHAIWILPPDDLDISHRIGLLKSTFTTAVKRRKAKGARSPWQRRSWTQPLETARDIALHRALIYHSPIEAGLCDTPLAWPHSSVHRDHLNGRPIPALPSQRLPALPSDQMTMEV